MVVRGWKLPRSVFVGVSAVEIVPLNRRRLGLWLRNVGTRTVYLGASNAVNASAPIVLKPGESFRDAETFDGWWAIADHKDGATLTMIEVLR